MNIFIIVVLALIVLIQFFTIGTITLKLRRTIALNKTLFKITTEFLNGVYRESIKCTVKGSYYKKVVKHYRTAQQEFFKLLKIKASNENTK